MKTTRTTPTLEGPVGRWYSSDEAAEYLNIDVKTLYRLQRANKITHYKVGRLLKYRVEHLDEYLESCLVARR